MMPQAHRELEALLDRQIETARSLGATLVAEREALIGDSPEAVHQRAAEKIGQLRTLENLEEKRRALCGSLPLTGPGVGAAAAERWRSLMELVAGCRTANELNGNIIHLRQSQIGQLLNVVRGGPALTYGPRGKTFSTALRALARA